MSLRGALLRVGRSPLAASSAPRLHAAHNAHASSSREQIKRWASTLPAQTEQRVQLIAGRIHASARTSRLADLHNYYSTLLACLAETKLAGDPMHMPTVSTLTMRHFVELVQPLAASARPRDLALVERILADMSTVFLVPPTLEIHFAVIQELISHGYPTIAFEWLKTMRAKPERLAPSLELWHLYLTACAQHGEIQLVRSGIAAMVRSGCSPENSTYLILLNATAGQPQGPSFVAYNSILDLMQLHELRHSRAVARLLRDSLANFGRKIEAAKIHALYCARFPPSAALVVPKDGDQETALEGLAVESGVHAAVDMCKVLRGRGYKPSTSLLKTILRSAETVEDLRYMEKQLGVPAEPGHWAVVIENIVASGKIDEALQAHDSAFARGIQLTLEAVQPLIVELCRLDPKSPPVEANIDRALELYHTLEAAELGPNATTYNTLLSALGKCADISKYHPIILSLLEDMEIHKIHLNTPTVTSLTAILMRQSPNINDAYAVYDRMRNRPPGLDAVGYVAVLHIFCQLATNVRIPKVHRYFDIMRHMKEAGHPLSSEVYAVLFRKLLEIAKRMQEDRTIPENLTGHLKHAATIGYNQLMLEASFMPDTTVCNLVLQTYMVFGDIIGAWRVWDDMSVRGILDQESIAIMLEGSLALEDGWYKLRETCERLFKQGTVLSQENWLRWLRATCYMGNINEAVRVVCLVLPSLENVQADETCVRIVLEAANERQKPEVRKRIERYLPELWESLPAELREDVDKLQ